LITRPRLTLGAGAVAAGVKEKELIRKVIALFPSERKVESSEKLGDNARRALRGGQRLTIQAPSVSSTLTARLSLKE
jgi:hypothetical protein